MPRLRRITGPLLGMLAAACGGGSDGTSGPPPAPTLTLVSGNAQTGQAGLQLPVPITVSAISRNGSVAGLAVRFTVEAGGGTLSRSQGTTDATGTVSVLWSLGGSLGEQRLRIAAAGATSITASATATPGPPALVTPVEGNGQFAVVRRRVPARIRIQVTDAFGNPLGATPVTFSISSGGGSITDSTPSTDAAGFAQLGSWILGPVPGFNRVRAVAGVAIGEVIAIGTPASLVVSGGDGQTANVGTLTQARPVVTAFDGEGQPLAAAVVTFAVQSGGGSVKGGTQPTVADGTARPDAWILGLTPGENQLQASTPGVPPVTFTATGVPAVPAIVTASGPTSFSGLLGNFLDGRPEVRVTDAGGLPVAGVPVSWSTTGGGTIFGATAASDFEGRAGTIGWRLGPTDAGQGAQAAVQGLAPVQFTASASPPPGPAFTIEVRYPNTQPSALQKAAFDQAAARWSQLILGDLSDIHVTVPASSSGCYPALDETVDDLLIFADLVPIDGPGGVLGSAGPCLIRTSNTLSLVGRMRFDLADLANVEANGQLNALILHEMGHVLGMGSLWQIQDLLIAAGSFDPYFVGRTAQAAFLEAAGPGGFGGNIVPVENTGGAGTRDVHWREVVLRNELMTGFLSAGPNPVSAITVSSLRDQGYLVNDVGSDPYTLVQLLVSLGAPAIPLREVPPPWPVYTVNRRGVIDGVIPRR